MAREMVLMEKEFSRMNVPAEKVQKYLDEGWTEISRETVVDEPMPTKPAAAKTAVPAGKVNKKQAAKKGTANEGDEK